MDKAIIVDWLIKQFKVIERKKGLFGSVSSLLKPERKTVRALKKISFSIEEGELVGFIGPNGAGKTTTLKLLSGLLYPTGGFVQVLGFDPWNRKPEFLKDISLVMGKKNQLWWDLPAIETFELNKAIYELGDREYERSLDELIELLDVGKFINIQVRRLSLGQRMRLELVAALLHKPRVMFLDEPTIGLDLIGQKKIRDFIADYNRRNKATVLLTSHNMDDLVGLVRRIIVINKGEIVYDGDFSELIEGFAKKKIIDIYFSKSIDAKKLESIAHVIKYDYPYAKLSIARDTSALAAAELLQNFPVADLNIEEEPIEDIIRRVFKSKRRLPKWKKLR